MRILNQIGGFLLESRRRNGLFFYLGMCLFALFLVFLAAFGICRHSLSEICHWLKPFKFSLSFGIYVFTLGWYLEYLKTTLGEKKIKQVSRWITLLIIIEMVVILLQSWQGSAAMLICKFPCKRLRRLPVWYTL